MNFLDQTVLDFFTANRGGWLDFAMLVVTYSGSYVVIGGLSVLTAFSFYIHRHWERVWALLSVVGGSAATTYLLKHLLDRPRPLGSLYPEDGSSFPSGHATFAMALYGFLFYVIWKHDKHHLQNPFIIFLGLLILLVGVSRLYLGVHYLTDVLAGYLVGFIWLLIALGVEKYLRRRSGS